MSEVVQIPDWSPRRWLTLVLVVFLIHVGFIFWLGERKPISPAPPAPAPVLLLAAAAAEPAFALRDPTLFALPRQQGFAGIAWLSSPTQPLPEVDWTEEPRWLQLRAEQLGISFDFLRHTNAIGWRTPGMPEPELGWPSETIKALTFLSNIQVVGTRPIPQLVTPIELPAWPPKILSPTDVNLLTNSVVEVIIGGDGRPLSATLLSESGSRSADAYAVTQARRARFGSDPGVANPAESLPDALSGIRSCHLVFEWQTLPGTNATAGTAP